MYDNVHAKKIAEKQKQMPLTDFASVTPETRLEDMNLNWTERDLPERKRTKHVHRLHPYLGKFIPQLVEIFLRKFTPKLVYDPFCGSGTTLVEANVLGIDSIGTDISAFNVLLSRVKTAKYDLELLQEELNDILSKLQEHRAHLSCQECPRDGNNQLVLFKKQLQKLNGKANDVFETDNEYIKTWFSETAQKDLLCYLHFIKEYTYQDILRIVLSRAARSARLVKHYDLDFPKKPQRTSYHCHKHRRTCQPVNEAYKFLRRYTIDTLARVKRFSRIRTEASVLVNHADSREGKLPKDIDMVFTSPPYVGLIDYHEQHRYSYELLGLQKNDAKEIGSANNGRSLRARKEYIKGINDVIAHTRDHMRKDALMIIVVNDKDGLYDPRPLGFRTIGRVDRHVNRRTGRRENAFYESILIWQKND